MSTSPETKQPIDVRHPRDSVVDALLHEEHGTTPLRDVTHDVLRKFHRGEGAAAAARAESAIEHARAPVTMARWSKHLAALLFCSAMVAAWTWFTRDGGTPSNDPAGQGAQDPAASKPVAMESLDQLRALLPEVQKVTIEALRLDDPNVPFDIDLSGHPVTLTERDQRILLEGLQQDARLGEPAGWSWNNDLRLILADGRHIAMAIYPYDRGTRQTLGMRGLQGDVWLSGAAVPVAREILDTAREVGRSLNGIVLSRSDLVTFPKILENLWLHGVDDADLAGLQLYDKLTELDCQGIQQTLGQDGLRRIAKCTTIENLSLRGCNVTEDGLMRLTDLIRLRRLDLTNAKGVTGEGFLFFAASAKSRMRPREVVLDGIQTLSDKGLQECATFLAQPSSLVQPAAIEPVRLSLRSAGGNIGSAGWRAIMGISDLRELDVSGWPVSAERAQDLSALANLHELHLEGCRLDDQALQTLANGAARLERLSLRDNPDLTMQGIEALATVESLRQLDLRGLQLDRDKLAVFGFYNEEIEILH